MLLFFFVHVPYQNMIIIVEAWNESPTAPSLNSARNLSSFRGDVVPAHPER